MAADPARLIWSLTNSGIGTTISANGNSGAWQAPGVPPWTPNAVSAIDLRYVEDIWIAVSVGAIVSSPTLVVKLNVFDGQGSKFLVYAFSALTTATTEQVSLGKHGSAASAYIVYPEWGQIAWTCSGGSATGTEIAVYGR